MAQTISGRQTPVGQREPIMHARLIENGFFPLLSKKLVDTRLSAIGMLKISTDW